MEKTFSQELYDLCEKHSIQFVLLVGFDDVNGKILHIYPARDCKKLIGLLSGVTSNATMIIEAYDITHAST